MTVERPLPEAKLTEEQIERLRHLALMGGACWNCADPTMLLVPWDFDAPEQLVVCVGCDA